MKKMTTLFLAACSCAVFSAEPVKASSFGFSENDATDCLQKAIDSGVEKLIVDNTGREWLVGPIQLRSGQEIVFAEGVVVRALPGAFKKQGESLFTAKDVSGVTLRGEKNAVLMMNKKDYQDTARYRWSEWRHLISLRGASDVVISGLTLKASGGDGIYVSTGSRLGGCRDVLIDNVTCDDHHRQGISIISAENLLVRNSRFRNTWALLRSAGSTLSLIRIVTMSSIMYLKTANSAAMPPRESFFTLRR